MHSYDGDEFGNSEAVLRKNILNKISLYSSENVCSKIAVTIYFFISFSYTCNQF